MNFFETNITEREANAARDAILEGHLATGVLTAEFEIKLGAKFGYPYVVAVNSGTSALILALYAMGVRAGDEVIVTPYSFVATLNCIKVLGAIPVFCDVYRRSYNLDPQYLPGLITKKTKAILPVSVFGHPCDVAGIKAHAPNIPILEDAMEALGAQRDGVPVGMDTAAATFGFFPNKQITTGYGGVIVTKDGEMAEQLRALRQHGDAGDANRWSTGFGWNTRLADPLAAIGIVQLERYDEMQAALRAVTAMYDHHFIKRRMQRGNPAHKSVQFVYTIELPSTVSRRNFMLEMGKRGIPIKPYFSPLHTLQHALEHYAPCPVAELLGKATVALPFHYNITPEDAQRVWNAYTEVTACLKY